MIRAPSPVSVLQAQFHCCCSTERQLHRWKLGDRRPLGRGTPLIVARPPEIGEFEFLSSVAARAAVEVGDERVPRHLGIDRLVTNEAKEFLESLTAGARRLCDSDQVSVSR